MAGEISSIGINKVLMNHEIIKRIKEKLEHYCRDHTILGSKEEREVKAVILELNTLLNNHEPVPENSKRFLPVFTLFFLLIFMALIIFALIVFSKRLSGGNNIISQLIFQLTEQTPEWLWIKVLILYFSIVVASSILVLFWNWNCKVFEKFHSLYLFGRWLLFFIVPILFVFILLLVFLQTGFQNRKTEILFPQASELGGIDIQTYGTNAKAKYLLSEETPPYGPDGYAKITLKPLRADHSCGWIISFVLKGIDIHKYKQLRFLIRGERGGEKIGIKAKDATGTEVAIKLEDNHYLPTRKISTDWQQASIPFEHFGEVDFSFMDNFSLFTNGSMARTIPQTIYVGNFELR